MKVCVVGGDGFIGRRVVRCLAALGHDVASLDIQNHSSFEDLGGSVQVALVDLTNFEDVVAAFVRFRPEVVINLSYMRENLPRAAFKLNVLGMDNCFEAARLCGIQRVVYSSAAGVYGYQRNYGQGSIHETDEPHPINQYGVHKVFNEWQAHEYRQKHGMVITGIRASHVSGTDKLVGAVDHIHCIVKPALGEPITLKYRDSMRCVIHGDDMAMVFARVALAPKPLHAIYNSGGESLSLGDIAGMVRQVIPEARIDFEHETGDEAALIAYRLDYSRLAQEFGVRYQPYAQRVVSMIEAVRRGIALG